MDTCLILAELDPKTTESGLKQAREYLLRFSFTEDQSEEYKRTVSVAAQNWREFLNTGIREELSSLINRPHQWMRLAGEIMIEGNNYGVEFFIYPVSGMLASVSIGFSSALYDAMYSFMPSYHGEVDLNVKNDFMGLLHLMAISFSAKAFVFRQLTSVEDLVLTVSVADVRDLLTAPTQESIRRWKILLVGIQLEMVEQRKVERKWPAERLLRSNHGYLIYDGIV